MATHLPFHIYDVFTTTPYTGNPLAIVLDADGLTTDQMQTMAREFNLSETIFVMAPRDPANTARVRIFFPTAEIPFAGHPTLGCAVFLAERHMGPGDFDHRIVLEEEAGHVPVTLSRHGGLTSGEFTAPVVPHAHGGAAPTALIARALDLPPSAIGFAGHRPGVFAGGPAFLFAPVENRAALAAARPVEPHWSALMEAGKVDSVYLYSPGDGTDFQARMFSPTAGIPEDPATGSATAILAAQLLASGVVPDGESIYHLLQGAEMARPSRLRLTIEAAGGILHSVRIGGAAVPVSKGEILVPDTGPAA